LATAIRRFARESENQIGIPFSVRTQGNRVIPREVEQSLFRIVQGTISNIARHSQATEAEIHLAFQPNQVVLTVTDNGVGFDPTKKYSGVGLRSIRERVELLHGTLKIESGKENGTKITAICKT